MNGTTTIDGGDAVVRSTGNAAACATGSGVSVARVREGEVWNHHAPAISNETRPIDAPPKTGFCHIRRRIDVVPSAGSRMGFVSRSPDIVACGSLEADARPTNAGGGGANTATRPSA